MPESGKGSVGCAPGSDGCIPGVIPMAASPCVLIPGNTPGAKKNPGARRWGGSVEEAQFMMVGVEKGRGRERPGS